MTLFACLVCTQNHREIFISEKRDEDCTKIVADKQVFI